MFTLDAKDFTFTGSDLSRPECIVAEQDGTLWVSDNRGAMTRIAVDGRQQLLGAMGGKPNGMTMDGDGTFLMANIALRRFYRVSRVGEETIFLDSIEGMPVGAANFVERDRAGRLWMSVSSRLENHLEALDRDVPDGYVILLDEEGPKIVADRLLFTNEVRLDEEMRWLYMAETRGGRVSRAQLRSDGTLGPNEVFGPDPIFKGALIDGIRFDTAGNLWVTEITRNRLYVLTPDGSAHLVFEDPTGEILDHPSSLTFAGPDLKTVLVGGLGQSKLATFRAPFAGLPPAHWV